MTSTALVVGEMELASYWSSLLALKPVRKRQLVEQAHLTERIREIAATRVRYGCRRIHALLRREGWAGECESGLVAQMTPDRTLD